MKQMLALALVMIALALPSQAAADCFVTYKAKKQPPLELHFGVISMSGSCPDRGTAASETAARIASGGWTLLNVVSLSSTPPSSAERANAGSFYLRY